MLETLSLLKEIPDFKTKQSRNSSQKSHTKHYFSSFRDLLIHLFKKGNNEHDINYPIVIILDPKDNESRLRGNNQQNHQQNHQQNQHSQNDKHPTSQAHILDSLHNNDKRLLLDHFFGHHCLLILTNLNQQKRIQREIYRIESKVHYRIERVGLWTGTTTRASLSKCNKPLTKKEEQDELEEEEDMEAELSKHDGTRTMTQLLNRIVTRPNRTIKRLIQLKQLIVQEIDFIELLSNHDKEHLAHISAIVGDWSFPAHSFTNDDLVYCVFAMIKLVIKQLESERKEHKVEFAEKLHVPSDNELLAMIFTVRECYRNGNPFHNFRHAVDVLQASFHFCLKLGHFGDDEETIGSLQVGLKEILKESPNLNQGGIGCVINPVQSLALLMSALGHDVGHPGTTNAFLMQNKAPISLIYNDRSVLESYHAAVYINQILVVFWPSLLTTKIAEESKLLIHDVVSATILATDMSNHFEYLHQVDSLSKEDDYGPCSDRKIKLLGSLLLKAADISNVARPLKISCQWAVVLQREFDEIKQLEELIQSQRLAEDENGNDADLFGFNSRSYNSITLLSSAAQQSEALSVIEYFDNEEIVYEAVPNEINKIVLTYPVIPQGQLFFIRTFAEGLFENLSELYPSLSFARDIIKENKRFWESKEQN